MSLSDKIENIYSVFELSLIVGGALCVYLGDKWKKPDLNDVGVLSCILGSSSLILSFPAAHANAYHPNNRRYTYPYGLIGMALAGGAVMSKHIYNSFP